MQISLHSARSFDCRWQTNTEKTAHSSLCLHFRFWRASNPNMSTRKFPPRLPGQPANRAGSVPYEQALKNTRYRLERKCSSVWITQSLMGLESNSWPSGYRPDALYPRSYRDSQGEPTHSFSSCTDCTHSSWAAVSADKSHWLPLNGTLIHRRLALGRHWSIRIQHSTSLVRVQPHYTDELTGTSQVKCLVQEHNTVVRSGFNLIIQMSWLEQVR